MRASSVWNRQSAAAPASLRRSDQADVSSSMMAFSGMRRVRGRCVRETLPSHRTVFDFGHIQPRAVFRRVVDFKPLGQATCLRGRKRLVEARHAMRIQVVHHQDDQDDLLDVGVMPVEQLFHAGGPVGFGALVSNHHRAPRRNFCGGQRLEEHEQVA